MGGLIIPYIKQSDFNYLENRAANRLPSFTLTKFLNNSFQNQYELALADQLPLNSKMKVVEKSSSLISKLAFYKLNHILYQNLGGIYLIEDNLVYAFNDLNEEIPRLDAKMANYRSIINSNPQVKWYLYYIEKDTDINFENNAKLGAYEYMQNHFKANLTMQKFAINNFKEFQNYFYKTDHHWNYKGSYKAYQEVIKMLTGEDAQNYTEERCFDAYISGSKATDIGGNLFFKAQLCAYLFALPEHDVYINGSLVDKYSNKDLYLAGKVNVPSYGDYYGSDYGLIEFDFQQPTKTNLLILGESYDNAINDLVASHFNKTYNVDLRAYKTDMGKEFNIAEFIKENDISQVLFIGNIDFYVLDTFMLEGGN